MSEENSVEQPKKTLSLSGKSLSVKSPTGSSFTSRKSSVEVTVEVKRKRGAAPGSQPSMVMSSPNTSIDVRPKIVREPVSQETIEQPSSSHLSERERLEKARALLSAEAQRQETRENEAPVRRSVPTPAFDASDDGDVVIEPVKSAEVRPAPRFADDDDDDVNTKRKGSIAIDPKKILTPTRTKDDIKRRQGKITVTQALSSEEGEQQRTRSMASMRRLHEKRKRSMMRDSEEKVKIIREVIIPETLTVQELANRMAEKTSDVIKSLMKMGVIATINQPLDGDTAEIIVAEFGHRVRRVAESDIELNLGEAETDPSKLLPRPPVVTVMGHVDHGKTSLLDALRKTDVAAGEAGGITQHIGAYQVHLPSGKQITFIDTPGHEAFAEMRARGANVTDIVVLVVAADDGVQPQTIEAIKHARAAGVPMVVAINKIDKPGANAERVKTDLLQHEIVLEDMGGDVLAVPVSAKQGLNLKELEDAILLQAEILDLRANPNTTAKGVVVEARMEKGRGSVATILVKQGTLRVGDVFVTGSEWGRVRVLHNDREQIVEFVTPGVPAEVIGLNGTPLAGDDFIVVESEIRAREIAEYRERLKRNQKLALKATTNNSNVQQILTQGDTGKKELSVIVKAEVQGSVEAIIGSLAKLANDEVSVRIIHSAVGGINESDINFARSSNAMIVGFNVRANPQARDLAKKEGINIRYYSIIYDVIDDMKAALSGMLAPTVREQFLGYAEIRKVFSVGKVGKVAGCMVTEGIIKRGAKVRLLRDNVVVHEGGLSVLKRFQDDVKEVKEGFECGVSFEGYNDIKEKDMIECFEMVEQARTI